MIIFFYILKDFLKYVLGVIVLCIFLFILFDFIHKTTKYFAVYKPETIHVVKYYFYQIPIQLTQAMPIAALLGSVLCMVFLSRTNEITAMRAAGMGPFQIGLPVVAGGAILSVLSLFIGEYVLPYAASQMHYVQNVLIEGESESRITDGVRWVREGDKLFNYRDYDPLTATMFDFMTIDTGLNFRPKSTLFAKVAAYDKELNQWRLKNIKVMHFNPDGTLLSSEHRATQLIEVPVLPKDLKKERRQPNELSLRELRDIVRRGNSSGIDITSYTIDMHVKFAFYFAALVVSLIGIKFAYRSERSVESVKGILLAFVIGMSYWFILNSFRALGKQGTVQPLVAAWSANFILLVIGMFEIWRTRRA